MTDALLLCKAAIDSGSAELVSEYQLKIEPDFIDARKILIKEVEEMNDPFNDREKDVNGEKSFHNSFKVTTTTTTNGFGHDPFADQNTVKGAAASTKTHFDDSFNLNDGFDSGFDTAFNSAKNTDNTSSMFGNLQDRVDPFARNTPVASSASPATIGDNASDLNGSLIFRE